MIFENKSPEQTRFSTTCALITCRAPIAVGQVRYVWQPHRDQGMPQGTRTTCCSLAHLEQQEQRMTQKDREFAAFLRGDPEPQRKPPERHEDQHQRRQEGPPAGDRQFNVYLTFQCPHCGQSSGKLL